MSGFSLYYIEANILCVIVFGIIFYHNHKSLDRRDKQVKYDRVLMVFITYFLLDCIWAAAVDETLPRVLVYPVSLLIYLCMAATIYYWFEFVMSYMQAPSALTRHRRTLMNVSFLISTIALIVSFFVAPEKLIGSNMETLPLFNLFLTAVPDLCMIVILVETRRRRKQEENPVERKKLLFIGYFPLMVSIGGFIEATFLPYVPIYCFTCLILILVFYIDSIENRISVDPLTGLNNRGQLARYCAQRANLFMEGRRTVVVMMDVDRFKQINDTYGHAEGDRALVTVSDALKRAVEQSGIPSFVCRYGGDEFLLIIHPIRMAEAGRLIGRIRRELVRAKGAYTVAISAGYDQLNEEKDSLQECIVRADEKLYQDKEQRRAERNARGEQTTDDGRR